MKDPVENKKPRLEAHHIIPRAEGGRNTLNNGVTLCSFCHYYVGQIYLNHNLDFRQLEALKSRVQRIRESRKLLRAAVFNHLERVIYG